MAKNNDDILNSISDALRDMDKNESQDKQEGRKGGRVVATTQDGVVEELPQDKLKEETNNNH